MTADPGAHDGTTLSWNDRSAAMSISHDTTDAPFRSTHRSTQDSVSVTFRSERRFTVVMAAVRATGVPRRGSTDFLEKLTNSRASPWRMCASCAFPRGLWCYCLPPAMAAPTFLSALG